VSDEQTQPNQDDPSGPGWRDVEIGETLQSDDVLSDGTKWVRTDAAGSRCNWQSVYRRRIELPQQPSDSEPETMEDLRRRLAEYEVLLAEADRGGQQVNAELQQLREQLATTQHLAEMSRRQLADEAGKVEQLKQQLWDAVEARQKAERELKAERDNGMTALRSQNRLGQESLAEALQAWLRPVLELVAEHPDDCGPLAVSVLGYLPGIASRLIEE
jgi:hypothetical protein